jgi:hypothetical protein
MKFPRLALYFSVLALLIGGVSALADPVPVTFTGVNGAAAFGYYVGPYQGTINGDPVTLYCVDGSTDLSNTRYGGAVDLPNALTLYQEAAWLTTQYAANMNDVADIQATIWQLFDPSAPTPSSDYWLDLAEADYKSVDFSDFELVTNVDVAATGQVQEFLVDPAPVPKPTSIVLFGTALILAGAFLRRRIRAMTCGF